MGNASYGRIRDRGLGKLTGEKQLVAQGSSGRARTALLLEARHGGREEERRSIWLGSVPAGG